MQRNLHCSSPHKKHDKHVSSCGEGGIRRRVSKLVPLSLHSLRTPCPGSPVHTGVCTWLRLSNPPAMQRNLHCSSPHKKHDKHVSSCGEGGIRRRVSKLVPLSLHSLRTPCPGSPVHTGVCTWLRLSNPPAMQRNLHCSSPHKKHDKHVSSCGEGGIRTLEGALKPPTPLAGERLRPLSHLSYIFVR